MNEREVLLGAADLLERDGWCRGGRRGRRRGALVAIRDAPGGGNDESFTDTGDRAWYLLEDRVGPVNLWNDYGALSGREVARVLREVAETAP